MPQVACLRRLAAEVGDKTRCRARRPRGRSSALLRFSGPLSAIILQAQVCDNLPLLTSRRKARCPRMGTERCPDPSGAEAVQGRRACGTEECYSSVKEGLSNSERCLEFKLQDSGSPMTPVLDFPAVFLRFLQQNQLDPSIYRAAPTLPRYVRWLPCIFCLVLSG